MTYQKILTVTPDHNWKAPLILKKDEAGLGGVEHIRCTDIGGKELDFIEKNEYLFINAPDLEAGSEYRVIIIYDRKEEK